MSYKSIIDSLDVEHNPAYQPRNHGALTFCNYFAQDVMRKMGEDLPTGGCTSMQNSLRAGYSHWKRLSAVEAQNRANAGFGAIGITYDHVVVIYPGHTASTLTEVYMSMAGNPCRNNRPITYAWTPDRRREIEFYSYYPTEDTSFTCDTHSTVTIQRGKKYTARITCASYPNVVAGTGGIVSTSLTSRSGNNYYIAFTGVNVGATGIYINNSASAVFVCKVV